MPGLFDYIWGGQGMGGGGLLSQPQPGGLLTTGMAPQPTQAAPYAAMTPQPPPPRAGGLLGGAGANIGSGIVDYLRSNPSTISALAAALGGAPSLRVGLAQAAGAMPQAKANDLAWSDEQRKRAAINAYLSDPKNIAALGPGKVALLRGNPSLAESVISQQFIPKTPITVHPGDILVDPVTHEQVYSAGSGFRPMTAQEKQTWGLAPNQPGFIGPDGKPSLVGGALVNIFGQNDAGPAGSASAAPLFPGEKDTTFLGSLSPEYQQLVKGLTDYTIDPVKAFSNRSGERATVLAAAQRYDPTFDMSKFPVRQAMAKSVTSGNYATGVNAANTAIGHLNTLKEVAANLNNGQFPTVNAALNFWKQQTGEDAPTNFGVVVNGLASELGKLYKGTGAASLEEVNAWRDGMSPNMSPKQFEGMINTALDMMSSRLATINEQYVNTMGGQLPFRMLTPQSVAILKRIGIDPETVEHGDINGTLWPGLSGGVSGSPSGPLTNPTPAGGQKAPPAVGTIQDGYRYKGGNPADPKSWEKLP